MASAAADIFRQAACLNSDDHRRRGNVVHLEDGCDILVAGDLHGYRAAMPKILTCAALATHPTRRLLLQEIVHGPEDPRSGYDRSAELLLRAARLKTEHPEQVLFVLGNHDVAQLTGNEILKDGRGFCRAFETGVEYSFEDQCHEVLEAMREFFLSLPLAVRCPNRVWISHSLPAPQRTELAGVEILQRPYRGEDLRRGEPLYEWTWGRGQTDEQMDALAETLDVDFFVLGHQPCETGFQLLGRRAVILATDHEHGCILHFSTDCPLTSESVEHGIRRLAAIRRPGRFGAAQP